MIKLLLILPVLLNAVSDGLQLRGLKLWGKQFQVLHLLSWMVIWWQVPFTWQLVVVYFMWRAILFNYVHNLSAGLKLGYVGQVSIVDRLVGLLSFGQWWMVLIFQVICGLVIYLI